MAPRARVARPKGRKVAVTEPTAGVEMKRSLSLTGVTVNAMALIAPGAFRPVQS